MLKKDSSEMHIQLFKSLIIAGVLLASTACWHSHDNAERRSGDPDSVAGKGGGAAYKVSKEAEKAAKVIGHKVADAAKDAHAGWKNAAQEDKAKR